MIEEKSRLNQFIKNPLSNNSSNIDSIKTKDIIVKKSNQFPFRFPNLEDEFSTETPCSDKKGRESIIILKSIIDNIVANSISQ